MLEDVNPVRHTFLETIVPPPFLGHSIATLFLYLLNQNLGVSILQAIAETGGEYIQAYTSGGHVSVFRFVRHCKDVLRWETEGAGMRMQEQRGVKERKEREQQLGFAEIVCGSYPPAGRDV